MNYKAICLIFSLSVLAINANAQDITICGKMQQGSVISGYAPDTETLYIDGENIKIAANGMFLYAFDRDAKLNHKVKAIDFDGNTKDYSLKIEKTAWDIQKLTGVEQKKVTPSKQDEDAINKERKDIRGAQSKNTDEIYWQESFILPVEGRISGKFGGQRIMNGKGMNPHMGMDIAAIEGTPIKAPAAGKITLSNNNDYFYSGNVVVIDHGHNLHTIYAHLLDAKIKVGEVVKKGDIIGTVGKTGRVTGAHLHWGASMNGIRFDPSLLLKKEDFCFNL